MKKYLILSFSIILSIPQVLTAQTISEPSVDIEIIDKIMEEGIERSQVMEFVSWLTDVYGPRLTNSPQMKNANEYTKLRFEELGLENAHLHQWGPFGKGWELNRFAMHANTPYSYFPVTAYPKAWSPGHERPVKGEVVFLSIDSLEELDQYRGKLGDKFVMVDLPQPSEPGWDPVARRLSDEQLLNLANASAEVRPAEQREREPNPEAAARAELRYKIMELIREEKPLALLDYGYRGWYGQIAVSSAVIPSAPGTPWNERPRAWDAAGADVVPQISLIREHYGRIFRMLDKNIPVEIELDMQVTFHDEDLYGYNTIAEIPGTDPDLKEEVVMLGAHLDSWHGATGATDNASGSAVMMEVVRILKEIGAEPRRTIRIALWGGEEQGLHGSREYVADHYGVIDDSGNQGAKNNTEHGSDNFSAYYNIDNGTGQVRGIYLQQNEEVRLLFKTWLKPFESWEANTVTYNNTGSTDHAAFNRIGLPGFQFIQDPVEYSTMTHHSNMDYYERLVEQDLQRTAVIVASFVYHTAMLDEKLPRK